MLGKINWNKLPLIGKYVPKADKVFEESKIDSVSYLKGWTIQQLNTKVIGKINTLREIERVSCILEKYHEYRMKLDNNGGYISHAYDPD